MARKVDKSDLGSLSQEDLLYLRDRGRLTADEEAQYLGDSPSEAPTAPNLSESPYVGDEQTGAPPDDQGRLDNGLDPDDETFERITEGYDDHTVADLNKEISLRNDEREDGLIEPDGTKKADLVAALNLDDEINGED